MGFSKSPEHQGRCNVAREEGDLMISKIVMHGGREIIVPTDKQ